MIGSSSTTMTTPFAATSFVCISFQGDAKAEVAIVGWISQRRGSFV